MAVFIFQSCKDCTVLGFTEDRTGENLPGELAPWRPMGGPVIPPVMRDEIEAALQTDGYFVAQGKSVTRSKDRLNEWL